MIVKSLKQLARLIFYKEERRKVSTEKIVRRIQDKLFHDKFDKNAKNLIVFIVSGADWFTGRDSISGGILSIASIFQETEKLTAIHDSEVIMVTGPNEYLLAKHTQFPNDIAVFRFSQLRGFENVESLLIHIPEFKLKETLIDQIKQVFPYLSLKNVHINILNQRIDLMPSESLINILKERNIKLTQTTAHERYTTKENFEKYGIPLHKLSVYATPERYNFKAYKAKEKLILISPDKGTLKREILGEIEDSLPDYSLKIVENLTYLDYLSYTERALYTITFGEGLDFYFIETVFSGGIAIAVYNEEFFTIDFKNVPGVFNSYEDLRLNIIHFIESTNRPEAYAKINSIQFDACYKIYNDIYYKRNLENFYLENYTFK